MAPKHYLSLSPCTCASIGFSLQGNFKWQKNFLFSWWNKAESLSLLTRNLERSSSPGSLITTFEQPSHINYKVGIPHFFFLKYKDSDVLILIGMKTIHDFSLSVWASCAVFFSALWQKTHSHTRHAATNNMPEMLTQHVKSEVLAVDCRCLEKETSCRFLFWWMEIRSVPLCF